MSLFFILTVFIEAELMASAHLFNFLTLKPKSFGTTQWSLLQLFLHTQGTFEIYWLEAQNTQSWRSPLFINYFFYSVKTL